jgi:type IV secretory pathway VirJ component
MNRRWILAWGLCLACAAVATANEEVVRFGRFGPVTVYRQEPHPPHVVLFVSGDGGWNKGVVDMARELAGMKALVAGVDITHYLKELSASPDKCLYPASDFEALSQFLQKKLDFPHYVTPVLAGYSSGATLVYAVLVQAPPSTFAAALSLGFCPDFPATRPFCRGTGLAWEPRARGKGVNFLPATALSAPWVVFQGTIDQVCNPPATEAFVAKVGGAEIVVLPKVGHGFGVFRNWLPQFKQAFARLVAQAPAPGAAATATAPATVANATASDITDLPVVEVPAQGPVAGVLAVIVSGDGGWAGIDRQIGGALAKHGVRVVGLNSLQYFWTKKTPEISGRDLERILMHYDAAAPNGRILLAGYSRGAEVLPFMADRLSGALLARVAVIGLLAPTPQVAFEFHLTDWLGDSSDTDQLPVRPEVEKLAGKKIFCFYGADEKDSLCPSLAPALATAVRLPGAHHFGGDYEAIADALLAALQQRGQ